jgi:hypothetical protein
MDSLPGEDLKSAELLLMSTLNPSLIPEYASKH